MTQVDACDALAIAAREIARRVAQGSTLWTVAPGFEDHARHLAVEYVHPASVGAMAVPAIAVVGEWDIAIRVLREQAQPGDVIISMGSTGSAPVIDLSFRSAAWGTDHVHIGWQDATSAVSPDPRTFIVTLGPDSSAERLLTRAYHLLWELTFICLQNNRLTTGASTTVSTPTWETRPPAGSTSANCRVCADEATTTEVVEVLADYMARVRTACGPEVVDVSLIDDVRANDLILVHAGIALRRWDPAC